MSSYMSRTYDVHVVLLKFRLNDYYYRQNTSMPWSLYTRINSRIARAERVFVRHIYYPVSFLQTQQ